MVNNLKKGQSPRLMAAVKNEYIEDVKNLFRKLEGHVEETKEGEDGYTPLLIIMAQLGNVEFLKKLVGAEFNFDVNTVDEKGVSALQYVLNRRNLDEAKILIQAGANVDSKGTKFGKSALHVSAQFNNIEMSNYLLSKGANVNIKDQFGHTPMHKAAMHYDDYFGIIEVLLKNGADVNIQDKTGKTPLHYLVSKASNINAVKLFLSHKADVSLQDTLGETPLFKAVRKGHTEIVQLLVNYGSDVKCTNSVKSTPLHEAAKENRDESHLKIAEILLKRGADVNAQDNDLNPETTSLKTPLSSMGVNMEVKMVQLLLNYKPNLTLQDSEGETSLVKAICVGDYDSVQLLIDYGADIKGINSENGLTPLHYAGCWDFDGSIIKFLLKNGADINALDHKGLSPLMYTIDQMFYLDIEKNLNFLCKYSDINILDREGMDIAYYASSTESTFKVILNHLAMLQALGFSLHPRIMETLTDEDTFTDDIESDYFGKCEAELAEAKKTKLPNSWVTFFNLLTDNKRKLKNYAGNTDSVRAFKKSNCEDKFPIYGASMQENMKKGIKRREIFDESSVIFSQHLPIFKPSHLIVRDIFDCVSTKDLKKFCAKKNSKRMRDHLI